MTSRGLPSPLIRPAVRIAERAATVNRLLALAVVGSIAYSVLARQTYVDVTASLPFGIPSGLPSGPRTFFELTSNGAVKDGTNCVVGALMLAAAWTYVTWVQGLPRPLRYVEQMWTARVLGLVAGAAGLASVFHIGMAVLFDPHDAAPGIEANLHTGVVAWMGVASGVVCVSAGLLAAAIYHDNETINQAEGEAYWNG